MDLPIEDERPRYQLAADVIREEITTGKLKPGDKLSTNAEYERRFGIANMTVRNAIGILRKEGWVYSVQGKGTFVRQVPPAAPGGTADSQVSDEEANSHTAEYLELSERITTLEDQVSSLVALLHQALPELLNKQK
ncbi:GntR family transcriptional regulator [Kitasatospora sp. NPDC004723]|uniref:GntR family transcriptional regulator n=1 Tax=Kitasatospora sp. NPDC004723 TaxID=3154288 RepID=UPI0033A48ADE